MAIEINQVNDTTYTVDSHQVVLDQNGNWVAKTELTTKQITAFQRHIQAVKQFGLTGKASYTL